MPTNTDLVKDLPADFDIFGQAVDDRIKALNPETTLGDISYRSSTANTNTRLAIGTNGQYLSVSGGVPAWVTFTGAGKLKQVVQATTTAFFSFNTSTYTDVTGMSVSITPTANTSKILVLLHSPTVYRAGSAGSLAFKIVRGSTDVYEGTFWGHSLNSSTAFVLPHTAIYLDSPATTSATTYKLQAKEATAATSYWNYNGSATEVASITLFEIGA
jgi:hypothetical protein